MHEFLAENNACGQNLLNIVATGNSIIAEILRLKDYIPDIFRLSTKADIQKYGHIILDFKYLSIAEVQEQKIESQPELRDLDDEIRENYLNILTRFYLAFESTHQYAIDLKHFIDELNNGYYIQQNLESVLQDEEGKQLLCEALYIFGVILLIVDFHIPGVIRERLLTAYYRYSGANSRGDSDIEDVCMLLRSTGYTADNKLNASSNNNNNSTPLNYPEAYFARFSFDETFIDMVLARLRCDDIYNQMSIYPHPEHRSTALSNQAAMLFVCLYFSPKILHRQVAQMREIVDKFFLDNWMICIYMGLTVNLVDAWQPFKAAKAALTPVTEAEAVKLLCQFQRELLQKTLLNTRNILRDGVLNDYFVLQRISKILSLIRVCNVLLRWYFMHAGDAVVLFSQRNFSQTQQLRKLVCDELLYERGQVLQLLLDCSQLELTVKEILRDLLSKREERWLQARSEAVQRMQELSDAFSGVRPLTRLESNAQLQQWFGEIAQQIEKLSVEKPNMSGRVLIQLIQALEEVQEFHNLRSNMQVRQYLQEACEFLHKMIQIINVKEELLIKLQLVSDLSYAWLIINREYTTVMQESIKKQPKSVIRLRAAFLKLASALEIPLLRINQAKSEDLASVSNYYSTELANYMRQVLQIIPASMFSLLARIIQLQTKVLRQIPMRLDKDKLKEYAQFEERYTVSKLTHSIAVFTEGVLMMKKTLVGVLELDPKQLLEDGIRKELVQELTLALHEGLLFANNKQRAKLRPIQIKEQLEIKLQLLAQTLDGYRRSFAYIQDYLNVHGLKILQQELTRIVNYHVEQECNVFLRNKVQDWQSQYQNPTIPVPTFTAPDVEGNFIRRLAQELLACSRSQISFYVPLKAVWFERVPPHRQLLDSSCFSKLREALGPAGLVGLEHLFAHMFSAQLYEKLEKLQHNLTQDELWVSALNKLSAELELPHALNTMLAADPVKYYAQYCERWTKTWPIFCDWFLNLGNKYFLRLQLANELNRSGKCNSKHLQCALETFNSAILHELNSKVADGNYQILQKHSDNIEQETEMLVEMRNYLLYSGAYEPLEQVYAVTKNAPHLALFLCLFTIAHVTRLVYNLPLPKQNKTPIDGHTLLSGVCSLLQQFHADQKLLYLSYLCQYLNAVIEHNLSIKNELSLEATAMFQYLEHFLYYARLPRLELKQRVSDIVLSQWQYMTTTSKN